eukprot:678354-Hanusia_phi.AAC.1
MPQTADSPGSLEAPPVEFPERETGGADRSVLGSAPAELGCSTRMIRPESRPEPSTEHGPSPPGGAGPAGLQLGENFIIKSGCIIKSGAGAGAGNSAGPGSDTDNHHGMDRTSPFVPELDYLPLIC